MSDSDRYDPYGVLIPGGLSAWQQCCRVCGFRMPGALGHGPACMGDCKKEDEDEQGET